MRPSLWVLCVVVLVGLGYIGRVKPAQPTPPAESHLTAVARPVSPLAIPVPDESDKIVTPVTGNTMGPLTGASSTQTFLVYRSYNLVCHDKEVLLDGEGNVVGKAVSCETPPPPKSPPLIRPFGR